MIIYSQVKAGAEGPISQAGRWRTLRQCTIHPQERESHIHLPHRRHFRSSPPLGGTHADTRGLRAKVKQKHTEPHTSQTHTPHREEDTA